jgi:hypothetical protein
VARKQQESESYEPLDALNIMEPEQSSTIAELLERGRTQRTQILIGTENPARLGEIPEAHTRVRIAFDSEDALRECVRLLRVSDERLRAQPEQLVMWSWDRSFREGMTISFGVNWYDRDFFERRKNAFTEPKHAAHYRSFGATPEDFDVKHFVKGEPGFDEEVLHHREAPDNAGIPPVTRRPKKAGKARSGSETGR